MAQMEVITAPNREAYAFLFTSRTPGVNPLFPGLERLFASVLRHDPAGEARAEVRVGTLLLYSLAYETAEVGYQPLGRHSGMITTHRVNDATYTALLWEFTELARGGWHTTDDLELTETLGSHDVEVVALPGISSSLATSVDLDLKKTDFYVGAIELDPGNPLHATLFWRYLIHEWIYFNRSLKRLDWAFPRDEQWPLDGRDEWWSSLPFREVSWADSGVMSVALDAEVPPMSERGAATAVFLDAILARSHLVQVADAIPWKGDAAATLPAGWSFPVSRVPALRDAVIAVGKLRDYALNPKHPEGQHKARRFHERLGYTQEDWAHLAEQLVKGLDSARVMDVSLTQFGVQYSVVTRVTGPDGRRSDVRSAWLVTPEAPPKLTSVYIDSPKPGEPVTDAPVIAFVPPESPDRFPRLWAAAEEAGRAAAESAWPAPMRIEGAWISEGAVGFAWIRVPDARRGFARWLRQNKRGTPYPGGTQIWADTGQSIDRAAAYVDAFAAVLRANGIHCEVETHLD